MKTTVTLCLLVLVLALMPPPTQAQGYGVDGGSFPILTFGSITLPDGEPFTPIGATTANRQGGDFGPGGVFYTMVNNDLVTLDIGSGTATTIGPVTGISADHTVIGMGYDVTGGVMYMISTNLGAGGSNLYRLDTGSGGASLIGETGSPGLLALAVSCGGRLFGIDGTTDTLVRLDPTTGTAKVVGSLGADSPIAAQDADFEPETGLLYWARFNGTSSEIHRVDPNSGDTRQVSTLDQDLIAFGIRGSCPSFGYLDPEAPGDGTFYDPSDPFPSFDAAFEAAASLGKTAQPILLDLKVKTDLRNLHLSYKEDVDPSRWLNGPDDKMIFRPWSGFSWDSPFGGATPFSGRSEIIIEGNLKHTIGTLTMGREDSLTLRVSGDVNIEGGSFLLNGNTMHVGRDFSLGLDKGTTPGNAFFDLGGGRHTVLGNFRVGPDLDPESDEAEARNRYFLGGECGFIDLEDDGFALVLHGDYWFEGTGDRFVDEQFPPGQQGLQGSVIFAGDARQTVWHRQDEDAFFCDVVVDSAGDDSDGIELLSNARQNDEGTLALNNGIISNEPALETIVNWFFSVGGAKDIKDLTGGSRESHFQTGFNQVVESGNTAYFFPVGAEGHFFRPLLLQFPDDLGRAVQTRVDHREDPLPDDCEFPETGLIVDAVGGGTLTLNAISDMSWQLDFTPTPGFEADIRVEADGLPNIFDFRSLRLIQWDCDCTNPRLAGIYDLESDLDNEDPFIINDFINEVPNITAQEFVIGEACVILNIASNSRINPINLPKTASTLDVNRLGTNDSGKHGDVRHLANDSLDIYFDDVRALNDITAETVLERRPFLPGERKIDIVAAADLDNSNPLWSGTVTVGDNDAVVLTIVGSNSDVQGVLQNDDGQRPDSSSVTLAAVHGMPSVGTVNLRLRDPLTNATTPLADNLDFGTGGAYLDQAPGTPIIEILTPDNTTQLAAFRFDFSAEGGETLTIVASEDASGGLIATAYKSDGTTLTPTIITATDEVAEIPQVYFLAQNFPNPFNPETTIHYAVPQTSHVRLLVFNVLGQTIATLVDEVRASGIHRATFDAGTLPSGPYVYRLDAGPFTATRMMMLLK